jgi:hypothetical protein
VDSKAAVAHATAALFMLIVIPSDFILPTSESFYKASNPSDHNGPPVYEFANLFVALIGEV